MNNNNTNVMAAGYFLEQGNNVIIRSIAVGSTAEFTDFLQGIDNYQLSSRLALQKIR